MQRPTDGQSEKAALQINIVLNWFEELKQRVPVRYTVSGFGWTGSNASEVCLAIS